MIWDEKKTTFTVRDKKTGRYPDLESIALCEEWAKGLVYCDMEGFAIEEDGDLFLMDECGNFRYCPSGRFEIVWEEQEPVQKKVKTTMINGNGRNGRCPHCLNSLNEMDYPCYCGFCGQAVKWDSD